MLTPTSNTPLIYADDGYLSHQLRLVLLEKKIEFTETNIRDDEDFAEDLPDINPYNTLPVFIHRELILYNNRIIFEYLEDRYHQNKLLPENPIEKAQYRQLWWRIEKDWIKLADTLLTHKDTLDVNQAKVARKQLTESLVTIAPLFAHKAFFLSDTMGICDCILSSILYRLKPMGIELPLHLCRPLYQYMERMFNRPTFKTSLK